MCSLVMLHHITGFWVPLAVLMSKNAKMRWKGGFSHLTAIKNAKIDVVGVRKQMFVLMYSLLAQFEPEQFKPTLLGPPLQPYIWDQQPTTPLP